MSIITDGKDGENPVVGEKSGLLGEHFTSPDPGWPRLYLYVQGARVYYRVQGQHIDTLREGELLITKRGLFWPLFEGWREGRVSDVTMFEYLTSEKWPSGETISAGPMGGEEASPVVGQEETASSGLSSSQPQAHDAPSGSAGIFDQGDKWPAEYPTPLGEVEPPINEIKAEADKFVDAVARNRGIYGPYWECRSCGHKVQGYDKPTHPCPKCGGPEHPEHWEPDNVTAQKRLAEAHPKRVIDALGFLKYLWARGILKGEVYHEAVQELLAVGGGQAPAWDVFEPGQGNFAGYLGLPKLRANEGEPGRWAKMYEEGWEQRDRFPIVGSVGVYDATTKSDMTPEQYTSEVLPKLDKPGPATIRELYRLYQDEKLIDLDQFWEALNGRGTLRIIHQAQERERDKKMQMREESEPVVKPAGLPSITVKPGWQSSEGQITGALGVIIALLTAFNWITPFQAQSWVDRITIFLNNAGPMLAYLPVIHHFITSRGKMKSNAMWATASAFNPLVKNEGILQSPPKLAPPNPQQTDDDGILVGDKTGEKTIESLVGGRRSGPNAALGLNKQDILDGFERLAQRLVHVEETIGHFSPAVITRLSERADGHDGAYHKLVVDFEALKRTVNSLETSADYNVQARSDLLGQFSKLNLRLEALERRPASEWDEKAREQILLQFRSFLGQAHEIGEMHAVLNNSTAAIITLWTKLFGKPLTVQDTDTLEDVLTRLVREMDSLSQPDQAQPETRHSHR